MGFPMSSGSICQFESLLLRSNEEFVRLSDDFWVLSWGLGSRQKCTPFEMSVSWLQDMWQCFQESALSIDHQMKREKKCAQFSELLAGIILQFIQNFIHDLEEIRFGLCVDGSCCELKLNVSELRSFEEVFEEFLKVFAECVSSGLESAHKVVVSTLELLSFVYRYLIGCVDKVGGKIYSPGSFLFRLIFVAIVLFLGSYVWIKFRQASYTASRRKRKSCSLADRASQLGNESDIPRGVYLRAVKDTRGSVTHYKYEPRFKPRREKLESGTSLEFNCLSLGSYDTPREAEIVRHIAAVLYGQEEGRPVQFEDGLHLPFPTVTEQENCPPSGKEKAVWVTDKTKELYAELLREKARRLQLLHPAVETTGSHHGHGGEARRSDPSPSAPGCAHSTAIELTCFTPPHGGNGVVEQPTTSASLGLGQEPTLTGGVFSASVSDCDFEQFISSMLQFEENDFPAMDQIEGDYSETNCVFSFKSTPVPPQSSASDIPTTAIVASLPQLGGVDQGLEVIGPHLTSATAITFQQLESLPEQFPVQQHVTCQEQRPEEFAGSNVELQQKLLESEVRISELEQKLRQSEVENEKWRSMFHQVAKLMSASNLDGHPVDIQWKV